MSAQFDDVFSKSNQRCAFRGFLEGLLLPSEQHKVLTGLSNTEPVVGAQRLRAQALNWFLSESNWDECAVQAQRLENAIEDEPLIFSSVASFVGYLRRKKRGNSFPLGVS